ncbi:unnamed protein product [Paramecium primaurelia]|uniref:WD40-repeat-containing domain n=1 Tax=Paramecium primaurelia TaxID=5886 RepID=A0A8S1LFY8_PARPR|nr:unnamed protein product [Paramecium primaurelia]
MDFRCNQVDHQNLKIIGFCLDPECHQQRLYCHYCLNNHSQHQNKTKPLELLPEWINEKVASLKVIQGQIQDCKSYLQTLIDVFIPYSNTNVENMGISELSNKIKGVSQIEVFEKQFQGLLKQSIDQIKLISDQTKENIKNPGNSKQLYNTLIQKKEQLNSQSQKIQQQEKRFAYNLIDQNSFQQTEGCRAIAFNKDDSIVIATNDRAIKVYIHDKGKLSLIQTLNEHKENVVTLNFMLKSDKFVSGSFDSSIIIWQYNFGQWTKQQQLTGHTNCILCLLVNNKEDLIISSSKDNTIKFWIKQNDSWQFQQTINEHTKSVHSLSLNEQQNQLISCSQDKQIFVIQEFGQKWIIKQRIELNQYGYRLCFINDNQFVFQPYCEELMQVYEFDQYIQQYKKTNEIPVKCGSSSDTSYFQLQYLKSKSLLFNKNGMFINILKKKGDNQFQVEQYISFDDHVNFGQISQDGNYMINWDMAKRRIQIRKYQEL